MLALVRSQPVKKVGRWDAQKDDAAMNRVLIVVGVLVLLVGIVFFFQGIGLIKGSAMTGESFWVWVGLILVVVGALAVFRGSRSGRRTLS
jgi:uncharacterized membrane protein YidH (DUF202 family)